MPEVTSDPNVEAKPVAKPHKLFRAIVVLGAALTAGPGCDSEDCCEPQPADSSVDSVAQRDAGVGDAPVDVVLILLIAVAGLASDERALLAALWQSRADSESSVRVVFDQLVAELVATGARAEVVALARRAAEDEVRHARICVELAAAYRGESAAVAASPAVRLPDYVADVRLRAALHALNLCCIGETIATGFVEACVAACADGELQDIHRRHFADEILHARVGWAHVASLSVEDRAALGPYVEAILRAQVTAWESRIGELPEHGVPGHGYPPRAELVAAVHAAVRDVVLPGFEHVAIDASAARAWFETHAAAR